MIINPRIESTHATVAQVIDSAPSRGPGMQPERKRWSITDWLAREKPPADIYDLLGLALFHPEVDQIRRRIRHASRELLAYQNQDQLTAQRVSRLQRELGRASEVISSSERLDEYHRQIVHALRRNYAAAAGSDDSGVWKADALALWLRRQRAVSPQSVDGIVKEMIVRPSESPDFSFLDEDPEEIPWFLSDEDHARAVVSRYVSTGKPAWRRRLEPVLLIATPFILLMALFVYLLVHNGDNATVSALEIDTPIVNRPVSERSVAAPPTLFDQFRREDIDSYELMVTGGGNPQNVPPEVVGIVGNSRLKHWGAASRLCFSPGGQLLASGGSDGTIIVWETDSGRAARFLHPRYDVVRTLEISPAGDLLAASGDGPGEHDNLEIRLWNLQTGELLQTIGDGHTEPIQSVAFNTDGSLLASAALDGTVVAWDMQDGTHTVAGPASPAHEVAFHPQSHLIASAHGGLVRLQETGTASESATFSVRADGKDSGRTVVAFHPDGRLLATTDTDKAVLLWDISDTGNPQRTAELTGHSGRVSALAFHPDGQILASGSSHGEIRLWDVAGAKPLESPQSPTRPYHYDRGILALTYSRDGRYLASGSLDGSVRIWNSDTMTEHVSPVGPRARLRRTAMSRNGRFIAAAGYDGAVWTWDLNAPRIPRFIEQTHLRQRSVALNPDGSLLATSTQSTSSSIRLFSTGSFLLETNLTGYWPDFVTFSASGNRVAAFSIHPDREIVVHETRTTMVVSRIPLESGRGVTIAFRPDDETLASPIGTEILEWSCTDGQPTGEALRGHEGRVIDVEYTPDGQSLVSLSASVPELIVWDMATSPPDVKHSLIPGSIRDEIGPLTAMAISPNGTQIATTESTGVIRIWGMEPQAAARTMTIGGALGRFNDVFFSPDSRHLIVADSNSVFYIVRLEQ